MRILFFYLILICFSISKANGQKSLKAYIDLKKFYSLEYGNYIEIFNKINSEGINYQKVNNELIGKIQVGYSIFQNDSLKFQITDTLTTTSVKDSIFNDLYDVRMISLIPGKFQLKVEYKDLNTNNLNKSTATTANFEITPLTEELINISNIQIADYISKTKEKNVLSKYGYDVLPHLGNYFSEECNTLPIYLELYNINLDTNLYFLTYQITEKVSKDELYFLKDTIGLKVKEIHPIIKGIDIHNLVTGEYRLIINLKNQKGDTISSSKFDFYRNNDLASISSSKNIILDPAFQKSLPTDSLYFFAKSLMPIIYNDDQKILLKLLKEKDTSKLRVFIQSFWQITAKDKKPYDVWITYKNQVLLIEKLYKTHNIHGFETERGRVYLKYGPPTAINARESSPSEYPYEIWQYNKIKTFSNKRFVFYNPDIVGNNYRLLHSDLNGEIKNFKWPGMLRKRNNSTTNVDDPLEGGFDHFGGESTEVYNQY